MERIYECPWAAMPCAPYLDKLLEALKDKPVAREKRKGWIVGASLNRLQEWRNVHHQPRTTASEYARQQVPWLKIQDVWPELGVKERDKRSRYTAVLYEFICNYEMMAHLVSLTPKGIKAMRTMARDNPELMHTIAVADLYIIATRHLPKEEGE
jgi:hypothetical protein